MVRECPFVMDSPFVSTQCCDLFSALVAVLQIAMGAVGAKVRTVKGKVGAAKTAVRQYADWCLIPVKASMAIETVSTKADFLMKQSLCASRQELHICAVLSKEIYSGTQGEHRVKFWGQPALYLSKESMSSGAWESFLPLDQDFEVLHEGSCKGKCGNSYPYLAVSLFDSRSLSGPRKRQS